MLHTRRTIPLSFDAPVIRSWRPENMPIVIPSDDEEAALPTYSASKVTLPSSSREPKSKHFLFHFLCMIFQGKNIFKVQFLYLLQILVKETLVRFLFVHQLPVSFNQRFDFVCRQVFLDLPNPLVLLKDILKYPSPNAPYASSGRLYRQPTTGGTIKSIGQFYLNALSQNL